MTAMPEIEFVLPGTWWSLELAGDPAIVERRIKDLIDRSVGPRDDLAKVRRDLREELSTLAVQSRTTKTDHLYIARTLIGPMPFPVSLAISRPGIFLPVGAHAGETAGVMLSMIAGTDPTVVENPTLAIVRSTTSVPSIGSNEQDGPRVARFTANYWVALNESGKLIVFTFTASLEGMEEPLLTLFDAVAYSIRMRASAAAAV